MLKRTVMMAAAGLVSAVTAFVGCETSQPGVKNEAGTVTAIVQGGPEEVTRAARQAVEELKLIVIEEEATQLDGRVIARTARDERVKIDVEPAGGELSEIAIRVGTFGDEATSLTILDKVRANLDR